MNLPEAHLEDVWTNLWFAKNEQQKLIDKKYQIFAQMYESNKETKPKNVFEKLALIILYDQIPRNIFRGSDKAYATDHIAFHFAQSIVEEEKEDLVDNYPLHFIITILMSYCHQESKEHQEFARKTIEKIQKKYPSSFLRVVAHLKQIQINHQDRINLFGRIPERNRYLGRESTEKELVYLKNVSNI